MWIYQDELNSGYKDFPQISKTTQAKARSLGLLNWIKIGRHIVYKSEWVEQYLQNLQNSNIRKAKITQEDN